MEYRYLFREESAKRGCHDCLDVLRVTRQVSLPDAYACPHEKCPYAETNHSDGTWKNHIKKAYPGRVDNDMRDGKTSECSCKTHGVNLDTLKRAFGGDMYAIHY